jgi:hypothetical protein
MLRLITRAVERDHETPFRHEDEDDQRGDASQDMDVIGERQLSRATDSRHRPEWLAQENWDGKTNQREPRERRQHKEQRQEGRGQEEGGADGDSGRESQHGGTHLEHEHRSPYVRCRH